MDVGVCWSPAVLEHKLERRRGRGRSEEVWNCRRLPRGLDAAPDSNRLFVASRGRWVGFFRLVPEVPHFPDDRTCPWALIFDARSWTPIVGDHPCRPVRGWTYRVPPVPLA